MRHLVVSKLGSAAWYDELRTGGIRMLENVKRTYALADYTVECKGGKWFFWKTARYGERKSAADHTHPTRRSP
jgi:hypothetical protein